MGKGTWETHRDDGYRALGRYFTEFAELISIMEKAMIEYLQDKGVDHTVAYLPFGLTPADAMTVIFFDMASKVHPHDDQEDRIAKRLRKAVREEIPFRNDAAHGQWAIGGGRRDTDDGLPVPVPPVLMRTKPGRGAGALLTTFTDLDKRSDHIKRLQPFLHLYGKVCFKQPAGETIRDFVRLNKGRLVPGPKVLHFDPL